MQSLTNFARPPCGHHYTKEFVTLPPLYPILDTASLQPRGISPLLAAEAFLEGGARILQYRHKTFWSRDIFAEAKQIAQLCHAAGALFVLNDRADYAALLSLDLPVGLHLGLHLGQDDLSPADARRLTGPEAILGFSTHNPDQMLAAAAEPVDYVAFGPVFPTVSKERPDPTVGLDGLRAVRALTNKPLVAIGGIHLGNARACLDAGANAVAVIGDLLPVSFAVSAPKQTLRDRMTEWQKQIQQ
jgi:thiamine-phosphate pyrophosphorylase